MGKELGILIDATGDLDVVVQRAAGKIVQGLQLGDVTNQNAALIINMHPGELKEKPAMGVGISSALLDHDNLLYKHKIRQQLSADGMQINRLDVKGDIIDIDFEYQ